MCLSSMDEHIGLHYTKAIKYLRPKSAQRYKKTNRGLSPQLFLVKINDYSVYISCSFV
ncbi:hypothetical protein CLV62_101454 [Dysgonomonas alginatilytica]|uniref:Uncharacterized protein n=1 Tax=Dysgonomonas alginatilytica TaxID=1605892 RepID=A0A2V3Q1J4_9BACT|nr:hypothetical protein CLV62_101454 [Dysgonomonas alginatilytica]